MPRHLVVQLARFGDLLQSKRLLTTLCTTGQTHLLVDSSLASLARLVYPNVQVHALPAHGAGGDKVFATCHQVFAELRSLDFDLVCNLNYSGLNLALSTLFPPEIVRGHKLVAGQPLRSHWTEFGFRLTRRRQTSPLNLVDFWAWLLDDPLPGEDINPPASPKGGGLGIVLAGREARRSLPMEILVPLARALQQGAGCKTVTLLGSTAEQPAARAFLREAPDSLRCVCTDMSGKTDWAGLLDVVQGLDLVLTPDTGVMHLAAHCGTPVLATFLSSAWAWETGPYGKGHTILQATTDCAPCVESRPCHNDLQCLQPFASRELLRLAGRWTRGPERDAPQGMMLLTNGFDELGQFCRTLSGSDVHAGQREARRHLLRELRARAPMQPLAQQAEQALYLERDWMLEGVS